MTFGLVPIVVGRPLGDDPALAHDDHPVADVVDDVHVVLDEQHGHPLVAQRLHVPEQRLGERRVHAGHRLVEHDHLRARTISARAISSSLRCPPESEPANSSRMWSSLNRASSSSARASISCSWARHSGRSQAGEEPLAPLVGRAELHVLDHRQPGQRLGQLEGADHAPCGRPCGPAARRSDSPSNCHAPLSGLSKPVSRLNNVVLPAPLGPISAVIAPRWTCDVLDVDGDEAAEGPA